MKTFKVLSHEGYTNVNTSENRFIIRADYMETYAGEALFYQTKVWEAQDGIIGGKDDVLVAAFAAGQWVAAWEAEDNG